jgi:hypothetical protein
LATGAAAGVKITALIPQEAQSLAREEAALPVEAQTYLVDAQPTGFRHHELGSAILERSAGVEGVVLDP